MGRPAPAPSGPPPRPTEDAISLHTQRSDQFDNHYLDDDAPELHLRPDDLPPLYSDIDESSTSASAPLLPPENPSAPAFVGRIAEPFSRDSNTGAEYYLDSRLSTDVRALEDHVNHWASIPPRQYVRVYGWHTEHVDNNGKKERKRITDFDVWADLTPYLYRDAPARLSWRSLRAVDDGEPARRGSAFKTRKVSSSGNSEAGKTLEAWYHRFCSSQAGLKCFRLERRVVGLDTALLHERLSNLRRSANYRGHLEISFPVRDTVVDVYNDCHTNLWRLTAWVRWLCYLTLLVIFTWPYLLLRTSRFEVAIADWPFSRAGPDGRKEYVSFSEDQWYGLWGRVIHNAVLEKRQGSVEPQEILALDRGGRPSFNTGQAGIDGVLGFIAASVTAFGEVNRQGGWGHDT